MKKLGVAIIGCGSIAHGSHVPHYIDNEKSEIKYFCDILPDRADKFVEEFGCGKAVYNYKDIVNDPEVDIVSICTPNESHAPIAIDFMKAGKDVLCEKPAARVLSEALDMQKAAHETGRVLNIGVCNRFGTAVNMIKDLIDDGVLGDIYHVYASFRSPRSIPGLGGDFTNKAVSGGGTLIDWGVHYIDLIQYCCGEPEPLTASGVAFSKLGVDIPNYVYESMWARDSSDPEGVYDVDDSVAGIIRTSGPVITIHGAWAQNIFIGEGYIDFMGDKAGVRLQYGGDFQLFKIEDGKLVTEKPEFEANNFYKAEIDSFINCVLTGEKNQAHIDYAIQTSKIMQAIYDSSDSGREVVIG
ncbi:MAG: Gfo/Idh/MocA family oxidoreductase [Clostridiales bacterium]|mgnify:FL=1|nr:Gfo/Idh/MocA family oxidoreductase [Clostridiales bacterium]